MTDRKAEKDGAGDEGLANRSVNAPRRPAGAGQARRPSPVTGSRDPAKVPDQQIPKKR